MKNVSELILILALSALPVIAAVAMSSLIKKKPEDKKEKE